MNSVRMAIWIVVVMTQFIQHLEIPFYKQQSSRPEQSYQNNIENNQQNKSPVRSTDGSGAQICPYYLYIYIYIYIY